MMRSMDIMQTRVSAISSEAATIQLDLDFSHELDPGLRHFGADSGFVALGRGSGAGCRLRAMRRSPISRSATRLTRVQSDSGQ
jgi:hypothetical protein